MSAREQHTTSANEPMDDPEVSGLSARPTPLDFSEITVSLVPNVTAKDAEPDTMPLQVVLDAIKSSPNDLREHLGSIRQVFNDTLHETGDLKVAKKAIAKLKLCLPAVAVSGIFSGGRKAEHLIKHTGLIVIDIDHLGDELVATWERLAEECLYALLMFISPSGDGIKIIFRIDATGETHSQVFACLQRYFRETFDLEIDPSGKDVSRLCYFSHDEYAFSNRAAPVFPHQEWPVEETRAEKNAGRKAAHQAGQQPRDADTTNRTGNASTDGEEAMIDSALAALHPDRAPEGVAAYDYWLKVGMALNSWDADAGLEKWRQWSERSADYDEDEIESKWRGFKPDGKVTLGTLFEFAKRAGWEPPTSVRSRHVDLESMLADQSLVDTSRVDALEKRGLMEFADLPEDAESNLLGNRWLVRNAAGLLFAPSGVGKSTAVCQASALWSLGEEAFGIKPARPLKIVIFQSEDDAYDIKEIVGGVRQVMGFTSDECEQISKNVQVIRSRKSDLGFLKDDLLPILETFHPDLVIINPIMSFIGGDLSRQEVAQQVFRVQLGAIMDAYKVGVLMVHHTGKTNNLDTSKLNRYQAQYLTFGSSELVNMIRCQLMIWPTDVDGVFGFNALKRSEKIGWLKTTVKEVAGGEEGVMKQEWPERVRYFSHHKCELGTAWVPANEADIAIIEAGAAKRKGKSNSKGSKGFSGLSLKDLLATGHTYTTKEIVETVVSHYSSQRKGEEAPSRATIERALSQAVTLNIVERLDRGKYRVPGASKKP